MPTKLKNSYKPKQNLHIDDYTYESWAEKFPDYKVDFGKLKIHKSWNGIIEQLRKDERFIKLEQFLGDLLEETEGKIKIFPYPDLLFSALNFVRFKEEDDEDEEDEDELKVIFIGQDPYHDCLQRGQKFIPQAMGLSFSVPDGMDIPSSLKNIYKNLYTNGHIKEMPKSGNLQSWAQQGCLMLNTALTVQYKTANAHGDEWQWFTDAIIEYISKNTKGKIFVLWGSPALKKLHLIDQKKHKVIISSHPSGLSCNNKLKNYPAFNDFDHFKAINDYLQENKIKPINWEIKGKKNEVKKEEPKPKTQSDEEFEEKIKSHNKSKIHKVKTSKVKI